MINKEKYSIDQILIKLTEAYVFSAFGLYTQHLSSKLSTDFVDNNDA